MLVSLQFPIYDMAPKKKAPLFDLSSLDLPFDISKLSEDGRLIVSIMMFMIKSQQDRFNDDLAAKDKEISALRDKVMKVENRLDDIQNKEDEAAERKNCVIFSGPNTPTVTSSGSCVNVAHKLLRDAYQINIPLTNIVSAQRLGKPSSSGPDKRNILVKFSSTDIKKDLFQSSKTNRPEGLYVRESLTPTRNSIFYVLRKAKREFPTLVKGCSSIDGRIYAWIPPPNPQARGAKDIRMPVNTFKKLDIFCQQVL